MKNINQAAQVIKTGEPRLHTSTFYRLRPFATDRYRPILLKNSVRPNSLVIDWLKPLFCTLLRKI